VEVWSISHSNRFTPAKNAGTNLVGGWLNQKAGMDVSTKNKIPFRCRKLVDCVWNVMAHAQKPDFVFRGKRTSPFKSVGASVQSPTDSRGLRISGSYAGYTMFRGSVKSTGYPLHSPVSPSLPHPCVTVCHHISTEFYPNCTFRSLATQPTWHLIELLLQPTNITCALYWYATYLLHGAESFLRS